MLDHDEKIAYITQAMFSSLESEEDPQVREIIASQLLLLDEKLFLSYQCSNISTVQSLVLRFILNNPELVKKSEKGIFLETYYRGGTNDVYNAIFDKIDRSYFQEDDRETWKRKVSSADGEENDQLGKLARICGLLEITSGLKFFKVDVDVPEIIVDMLWMVKRLLMAESSLQVLKFLEKQELKPVFGLIDRSKYEQEIISSTYDFLAVLMEHDQYQKTVHDFFSWIMDSSDYRDHLLLMQSLVHTTNQRAGIILCNGLSISEYSVVREKAARTLLDRKAPIPCLETVRHALIYDPDFSVRASCVQMLSKKGEEDDTGFLIRALMDPDKQVIKTALAALQFTVIDERGRSVIDQLLGDNNVQSMKIALSLMKNTDNENNAKILVKLLRKEKSSFRMEIIRALGETKTVDEEVIELLEHHLVNDEFFEARYEAALSLGRIKSRKAIQLLLKRYFEEEDIEVKRGIMIALTGLESKAVKQEILDMLRMKNTTEKELLLAIEAAGRMKLVAALDDLLIFFHSEEYNKRWQAVVSAGEIIEEVVNIEILPDMLLDALIRLVEEDSQPSIRAASCWSLMRYPPVKTREIIRVLTDRLMNDADNAVREMAAELLGKYRSPLNEAIPVLVEMLEKERDPSVRYYSAYSLGLIARSVKGEMIDTKKPVIQSDIK